MVLFFSERANTTLPNDNSNVDVSNSLRFQSQLFNKILNIYRPCYCYNYYDMNNTSEHSFFVSPSDE